MHATADRETPPPIGPKLMCLYKRNVAASILNSSNGYGRLLLRGCLTPNAASRYRYPPLHPMRFKDVKTMFQITMNC
jgi:hypothetical protein